MRYAGLVGSVADQYHIWYYNERVWTKTTFLGVPCLKSVSDMWNYQEIVWERKPSLVVEFGTWEGGSALYFSTILSCVSPHSRVLSIDIDQAKVYDSVRRNAAIELMECDTTSPEVAVRIRSLRQLYGGNVLFVVDSNHSKSHVLAELMQLRALTVPGDYVVVEDGNINGHPVLPEWGAGPFEALEEYFARYPEDYVKDTEREQKFGFTFAPAGFLIRRS